MVRSEDPIFRFYALKIAYIQTFVGSFFLSRVFNFGRTKPPGALILVWTFWLSIWTSAWVALIHKVASFFIDKWLGIDELTHQSSRLI